LWSKGDGGLGYDRDHGVGKRGGATVATADNDKLGFDFDAYKPAEIAARVETAGVAKTRLDAGRTILLGILAGAFIGFGALFYTLVVSDSGLGAGPTRMLGGLAFSLGLLLVVVAGAELFTGNSLIVMAWADRKVSTARLARNWGLVYFGNLIGAVGTAVLVVLSGILDTGAVGATAARIAETKLALGPGEAFFRGILCNVLVCLAVWLGFAARSVTDKFFAVAFPIAAFVAVGFEHSVANMYVLPVAMIGGWIEPDIAGLLWNLVFVTAGNIVGGGALVAGVYWAIYLRKG